MSSSEGPSPVPEFNPVAPTSLEPTRPEVPTSEERTVAMLAELLQLFSWIIYFAKRVSEFVRFHKWGMVFLSRDWQVGQEDGW